MQELTLEQFLEDRQRQISRGLAEEYNGIITYSTEYFSDLLISQLRNLGYHLSCSINNSVTISWGPLAVPYQKSCPHYNCDKFNPGEF